MIQEKVFLMPLEILIMMESLILLFVMIQKIIFYGKIKLLMTNNWLKVKLEGVTTNRDGIGNTIEIFINGRISI